MASGKQIAALLVAVTIAGTLLTPIADVIGGSTGVQTVGNQTVTADVGNFSNDLEGYDVVQDSETVYRFNSTSGANESLTEGTDYEFDYDNARVKPLAAGSVEDGDTLYVAYDYQATSGTVTTVAGLVPMFVALMILVVLANRVDM